MINAGIAAGLARALDGVSMRHRFRRPSYFSSPRMKLVSRLYPHAFRRSWIYIGPGMLGIARAVGVSLFLFFSIAVAKRPYEAITEASLDDRWRWTELEGLSGLGLRYAAEDEAGNIWFARKDGVVRYDGLSVAFFDLDGGEDAESVIDIHVSRSGVVYLLLDRYLAMWEAGEWSVEPVDASDKLFGNAIYEDRRGDVWIGLGTGVYRCQGRTVAFFDQGYGEVCAALIDEQDKLWLADARSGIIEVFDIGDEGAKSLSPLHSYEEQFGLASWAKLHLTESGDVWVIAYNADGEWYRYENYERRVASEFMGSSLFAWYLMGVAEAPKNTLWLSVGRRLGELVEGKLNVYDSEAYPIPTSYTYLVPLSGDRLLIGGKASKIYVVELSNERWASFPQLNFQCEDQLGRQWFLEHDGEVVSRDPSNGDWYISGVEDGLIDTPTRIFCSSDGTLWVSGSHEGAASVSYFEEGVWKLKRFPNAGSLIGHLSAMETEDGSILFGSGSDEGSRDSRMGGAVVFRKEEGYYEGARLVPPLFPNRTANIVERKGDGLWFGATSLMRQTNGGALAPERVGLLEDNWIDHLIVDGNNDLWAGVWGLGVYQYDGSSWSLHNESSGMASEQVVYLLDGALQKGIWAVTRRGLSRYDGRTWSNWDFPHDSLFRRESDTLYESSDGSLWINYAYRSWLLEGRRDEARHSSFRTVRYRPDSTPPETSLFGGEHSLPEGSQVVLEWEGKDSGSDTPVSKLEYSWRLVGKDWSPFSLDRSATIERLSSGSHIFEVRARDRDWNIDLSPARIEIAVIAPLWKRPWFVAVCIAIVVVIVYLINALLKARVRTALAMEEFKMDFFTNISHELRNPLSVIVGPLESLLRKETEPEARGGLQIALRNARKMQGLINQLLQFRKLELGKSQYNPSHGELIGFVKETIDTQAPLAESKSQTIRFDSEPSYCECSYDADKLQTIVDNLLSNAIKYSPEGGEIRIRLSVTSEQEQTECCLVVEDDGVGIPAHKIDLVLKPFFRVQRGKKSGEGFGIGLAFVGQLVQLWGGEIALDSPVGDTSKGTRVTVKLPLVELAEEEALTDDLEELDAEGLKEVATEMSRPKLLLVEDNEDLRQFMRGELKNRYETLEAEDGKLGLEVAVKENPDLVISDVMMPEMDGLEFCRRLRADREISHIPVILLTARDSEEHNVEGIKAGADEYFAKPLNMVRLQARIENLLESRKQLKERFAQQLVVEPTQLTVTSTDEAILRKAIEVVEARMKDEHFDADQFAVEMAMSRTTLYRKLKALTGQGPSPFIRSMRLKRAAKLLGSGKLKVSETLEHIGIMDQSHFSRIFKKEYGVSPTAYIAGES